MSQTQHDERGSWWFEANKEAGWEVNRATKVVLTSTSDQNAASGWRVGGSESYSGG